MNDTPYPLEWQLVRSVTDLSIHSPCTLACIKYIDLPIQWQWTGVVM